VVCVICGLACDKCGLWGHRPRVGVVCDICGLWGHRPRMNEVSGDLPPVVRPLTRFKKLFPAVSDYFPVFFANSDHKV
jgi:hypothetical protein